MFLHKKTFYCRYILAISLIISLSGCGQGARPAEQPPTPVKIMAVLQKDAGIVSEYSGQVQGQNEVRIQARVAGNVVEKLIAGGQSVKKGQPLFKIDSRPYQSALLAAGAQLANSEAALANISRDVKRYRELFKASAIAEQMLTTQEALERQQQALVASNRALWQKAKDDMDDTLIVSPIDGRLYVDDVSVGVYVQPGVSVLVTVGAVDPVYAVFNMSETEYLNLRQTHTDELTGWGEDVSLTLSNGEPYPFRGRVAQTDRALGSGTLTVKALFANPDGLLIPGMFTRVKIAGKPRKDALIIPQRAVQQVLDKSYVTVIGKDNKTTAKQVRLGQKTGSFQVVESGLIPGELIVVEGLARIRDGIVVEPTTVSPEELNLSFDQ